MTYKVDVYDDRVVEWATDGDQVIREEVTDYQPALYVDGPDDAREDLAARLRADPKVADVATERWFTRLRDTDRSPVLRVALDRPSELKPLAREIRHHHEAGDYKPGTFRLYNVDIAPQFRYCLTTDTSPVPTAEMTTFSLQVDEPVLADRDISPITIDGDTVKGRAETVLETINARLEATDPDVLVVNSGDLVPLLFETAADIGMSGFHLGREPGYEQLAGESTYESYGQVGHAAARYNLPGRGLIDTSNSFLWDQTSLDGLLDLVKQSWKPLQETAWGSIGNIFTAIQIRHALEQDVLVPWRSWDPEFFKSAETLHAADRGGFTFAPDVGLHEDVVELDFASLYPRIMVEYNISPDTICCDCHADREDVPTLGYNVCDEQGFLVDVLTPLLDTRSDIKDQLAATDSDTRADQLAKRSNALKWILVSCFGYQGFRNAKFGRIECHEAINAYARELLLTAKETFEANGWRIVHGIIDSIWVAEQPDADPTPIEEVAATVSEQVNIPLEYEGAYDWVAFVPKRNSAAGALTKYFGKHKDGGVKLRGIEARQRSTPAFIADAQEAYIDALDAGRTPEAVCDVLQGHLQVLSAGDVAPEDLVVTKRTSKPLSDYSQRTHTVGALQRAADHGIDKQPGQDIHYVVVDDDASRTRERVRLPFENPADYDADYYRTLLVRAAESITSPLGWDRADINQYLADQVNATLDAYQ